jgi:hypothetical protein
MANKMAKAAEFSFRDFLPVYIFVYVHGKLQLFVISFIRCIIDKNKAYRNSSSESL